MDELSLYYGAHTGMEIDDAVSLALGWQSGGIPDIASINITGATNDTGETIQAGTYFYFNGTFVVATARILDGASISLGSNCEAVTEGGLNAVMSRVFRNIGSWNSGSATISLPKGFGPRLMVFASADSRLNAFLIAQSASDGTVGISQIFKDSGISFSTGNGTLIASLQYSGNACSVSEMPLAFYRYSTLSVS